MKKDAHITCRVPRHIAELIGKECNKTGRSMSDFVRHAVLLKIADDNKTTIEALLKRG
jgi:uncharacterized protein (DUF1778 family)